MYQVNNGPTLAEIALSYAIKTPGVICAQDALATAKEYLDFLNKSKSTQETDA